MGQSQSQLPFGEGLPTSLFQDFNKSISLAQNTVFKSIQPDDFMKDSLNGILSLENL